MPKEGGKSIVLSGLSRHLVTDVPYTRALDAQKRTAFAAERLIQETHNAGESLERSITPEISRISGETAQVRARIENLQHSFEVGLNHLETSITGVPVVRQTIEELYQTGMISETEAVILAATGILDKAQSEKIFRMLEPWKIKIIKSGLVSNPDPKTEKKLSQEEKLFLAELRRKKDLPIANFHSLGILAENGLLDAIRHREMAKNIRGVRFGTDGTNYGMIELNEQTDVLIQQGQERSRTDKIGLDLMRAGVVTGEKLVKVGQEQLAVQSASFAVQADMDSKLGDLRTLAQRAEATRMEIAGNTAQTARNTACILRNTSTLVDLAIDESRDRKYGLELSEALVGISHSIDHRLAGIGLGIDVLIDQGNEQIEGLNRIGSGIAALGQIAASQLESLHRVESGLGRIDNRLARLDDTLRQVGISITMAIEGVMAYMTEAEQRTVDRDFNRDKIASDESFRKALELLAAGKIDKAIKYLNEAEERFPTDYRIYFKRGLCYEMKDMPMEAREDLLEAVDMANKNGQEETRAIIRRNLARLYYAESKAYLEQGDTKMQEEKLAEAIVEAKKATMEKPDHLEAHFDLATYLAAFKLYDDALSILLNIIPKDPKFAKKLDYFDVFTPLRGSLKHVLNENDLESGKANDNINLAIAKDAVEVGDFETALKCIQTLINKSPLFLIRIKIWEIEDFKIISKQILEKLENEHTNEEQKSVEEWYAIAILAIKFGSTSRSKIYRTFLKGAENDPDCTARNADSFRNKIIAIDKEGAENLFSILRLVVNKNFTWL